MNTIQLADVLDEMAAMDAAGRPKPFSIGYYTADRKAWAMYKKLSALEAACVDIDEKARLKQEIESIDLGVELRTVAKCVLNGSVNFSSRNYAKEKGATEFDIQRKKSKAQNHWKNRTRNIRILGSNDIRKVRIRLISEFNGKQVIY